ncbi:hypothetical protein [Aurantiacibacter sediminis]|uniref:Secreted protein n=1 Tax=Aurantiacibacter sediminis TaxID=2793064 RepID=A0ABS0N6Z8_9SPHN|nr:hypothetical protein [Aurantiacibacter sediminis]MBH5323540.1 hypothetical protein [Aurantiacibacter sediminis]
MKTSLFAIPAIAMFALTACEAEPSEADDQVEVMTEGSTVIDGEVDEPQEVIPQTVEAPMAQEGMESDSVLAEDNPGESGDDSEM